MLVKLVHIRENAFNDLVEKIVKCLLNVGGQSDCN